MGARAAFGLAVVVLVAGVSALAQSAGQARITGIVSVTDRSSAVLPGVTVTVTGPGVVATAVSDADGRFVIQDLLQGPPVTYRLTAEMPGFRTTTIASVRAVPGGTTRVAVSMQLGCADIDLVVTSDFVTQAHQSDAVLHLRVESVGPEEPRETNDACVVVREHMATVLGGAKGSPEPGSKVGVLLASERSTFRPGDEMVSFLTWDRRSSRYLSFVYNLPVRLGVIEEARYYPVSGANRETPVGEFLRRLGNATSGR